MFVLDVKVQYMFVFLLQNTLYCISFVDKKKNSMTNFCFYQNIVI